MYALVLCAGAASLATPASADPKPAAGAGVKPSASAAAPSVASSSAVPAQPAPPLEPQGAADETDDDSDDQAPATNPHGNMAPQNTSTPSPSVPKGTVRVHVIDAQFKPVLASPVKLGIINRSIAEGESRSAKMGTTDADGNAHFDGLTAHSDIAYRVTVPYQGAQYMAEPFMLQADMGEQVTVHVYPVTTDIAQSAIRMAAFVYIEPRDDAFQFEVAYQVFNLGKNTWVPTDLVTGLPSGWKAFTAQQDMGANGVTKDDAGARWMGTFSPGQHEVSYRFQVPNDLDEDVSFTIPLPPLVRQMQVVAEASPGMALSSAGFSAAQVTTNNNGQRVLAIGKQVPEGEPLKEVVVELRGIPVPGPGRWYAVVLAGGFVGIGLITAFGERKVQRSATGNEEDRDRARELLLRELVELERARRDESIGPRAHQQAREALMVALVRLGPKPGKRDKRSPKGKTRPGSSRRSGAVAN
jgi:hypothetical protein